MMADAPEGQRRLLPAAALHRQAAQQAEAAALHHLAADLRQGAGQGGQLEIVLGDVDHRKAARLDAVHGGENLAHLGVVEAVQPLLGILKIRRIPSRRLDDGFVQFRRLAMAGPGTPRIVSHELLQPIPACGGLGAERKDV